MSESVVAALQHLQDTGSIASLVKVLQEDAGKVDSSFKDRSMWLNVARECMKSRPRIALAVLHALYDYILTEQINSNKRLYKADVLSLIADCHEILNHPALENRFIVLAFIETVLTGGQVDAVESEEDLHEFEMLVRGQEDILQFVPVARYGWTYHTVVELRDSVKKILKEPFADEFYPESILLLLPVHFVMQCLPSIQELTYYRPNRIYLGSMLDSLKQQRAAQVRSDGKLLEHVCRYLFSEIAGCKVLHRAQTHCTDFDLWCHMNGLHADYRKELGQYWLVECKDWGDPVGFGEVAKFCRVLDSTNCKCGVIVAINDISGANGDAEFEDAMREVIKFYQHRKIALLVLKSNDLDAIAGGCDLISLLAAKYEKTRFDLVKDPLA
jgi:hypothetical protein